jgi:putative acetyltransferase
MIHIIRRERSQDIPEIREVNRQAFGQEKEALVVDRLRENCNSVLSLVALTDNKVLGHILCSPAVIEGKQGRLVGTGLAPLAVLPEFHRKGNSIYGLTLVELRQNIKKTKFDNFR